MNSTIPGVGEPSSAPTPTHGPDYLSVKRSMTKCDEEAARNPDGLYFLVTPVIAANFEIATLLIPPGEDYGTFLLVPSQALISGLENYSLQLRERRYEFAVRNADTAHVEKWSAANGASSFTQPHPFGLSKFQIGFSFENNDVIWTNQYVRQKGICYWVNVLVQARPYAPPSGRTDYERPKHFPFWARTLRCANRVCDPDPLLTSPEQQL